MKTIEIKNKVSESELMQILEANKKVVFKSGDLTIFASFIVASKADKYFDRIYYVSDSVYKGDDLLFYRTRSNLDSLLDSINDPYNQESNDDFHCVIKSDNGNYLFPIKGKYAMHYVWFINEKITKLSSESEYKYLTEHYKYDCEVIRDTPNQVQSIVTDLESNIGEFLPYYEHKRIYNKILRKMFGDAFERKENNGTLITVLENSYKTAIIDWDGAYDTPCARDIEEITKRYHLVFINHSYYRNDYRGRYRSISCGLNNIEFDSSGNYGCANGLEFELKIYKKK